MRENVSENVKNIFNDFKKCSDSKKYYISIVLLNHLSNGLINDGNYLDSDEAYENDALVLEPSFINFDNPMNVATELLLLASSKNNIVIDPNGIDVEPYIPKKIKKEISQILSEFYKLNYKDKIDFITEMLYNISMIQEVEKFDFDFNGLINELLTYRKETFGTNGTNNLEID